MSLHPQARALLEAAARDGLPPLDQQTPVQARAQARRWAERNGSGPDLAEVEDFTLPADGARPVNGRRYEPGGSEATLVWLHGGGWVTGDLDTHDAMCRLLAASSGCQVVAVDYRLAPEHRFPAGLEDCWRALSWIAEQDRGRPLSVGGDSAGGNLAAVCAQRARARGGPPLALQVLVYPVLDHDMTTASYRRYGTGDETFLTVGEMTWFWNHYLADPDARANPEASPLRATGLAGLPPAIVVTAECDPLRDEAFDYVARLREAGVAVDHLHYDAMIHSFFSLANLLEPGREAVLRVGAEVRAAVAPA